MRVYVHRNIAELLVIISDMVQKACRFRAVMGDYINR